MIPAAILMSAARTELAQAIADTLDAGESADFVARYALSRPAVSPFPAGPLGAAPVAHRAAPDLSGAV